MEDSKRNFKTKILSLLFISVFAFTLYSCSDSAVTNPITGVFNAVEVYDYTITSSPVANSSFIVTIDNNSYFILTSDGKFYRVTNGTAELFTVNSSVFKTQYATVFDNTYIVYIGARVSDNLRQYMVYDNGTYTIYDGPPNTNVLFTPYIPERGTFYITQLDSSMFYRFKNGTYTRYAVEGNLNAEIGKSNGSIYITGNNLADERRIYKMTETGPVFLRLETYVGPMRNLNNSIMRIQNSTKTVSAFTESGWTNLFTIPYTSTTLYGYLRGENSSSFGMIDTDSLHKIMIHQWDGTNLTKQTNVPAEAITTSSSQWNAGEFINRTNYILFKNSPQKVMKISLK